MLNPALAVEPTGDRPDATGDREPGGPPAPGGAGPPRGRPGRRRRRRAAPRLDRAARRDRPGADPGFEHGFATWWRAELSHHAVWLAEASIGARLGAGRLARRRRGRGHARARPPGERWGYVGSLVALAAAPRGVPRRLLTAAVVHAREHGLARLVLRPSAAGAAFYRAAGFPPAGDEMMVLATGAPAPARPRRDRRDVLMARDDQRDPGRRPTPRRRRWRKLRLRYAKRGRARFSSHRDIARTMEWTLRRAGVPVALSHGFSPHPRLSWIGAAPTGAASEAEYLEIGVTEHLDPEASPARSTPAARRPVVIEVVAAGPGSLADRIDASRWESRPRGWRRRAARPRGRGPARAPARSWSSAHQERPAAARRARRRSSTPAALTRTAHRTHRTGSTVHDRWCVGD